jgi:hypothetical protein
MHATDFRSANFGDNCDKVHEGEVAMPSPIFGTASQAHACVRDTLKSDHRLNRNFLKGFTGDQINLLMAAAAFSFRKWRRKVIFWLRFWCACAFQEYYQPNGCSLRGGI